MMRFLGRLLDPPTPFTCVFPPVVFALLITVFCLGLENTVTAYAIVFPLSAYALVLWVVKAPTALRCLGERMTAGVSGSGLIGWFASTPFGSRLLEDERFRVRLGVTGSAAMSAAYAMLDLFVGTSTLSPWFSSLGIYYLVLCAIRIRLVVGLRPPDGGDDPETSHDREVSCYRFTARLLLALLVPFNGMVVLMAVEGDAFAYRGYAIYAMAIYTFATVAIATVNVVRARRHRGPVLEAARALNFVAAAVSILGLQSAMIAQFSTAGPDYTTLMNSITGGIVYAVVTIVTVWMNVRVGKLNVKGVER